MATISPSKIQECLLLRGIYYKEGQAAQLLFSIEFSYDFLGFPHCVALASEPICYTSGYVFIVVRGLLAH